MTLAERKRLAEKLHEVNCLVTDVKRSDGKDWHVLHSGLADAQEILREVIETLMDASGMTDYYGNPTERA